MAKLVRSLGLWSSIGLVIGITIGGGIYRTPAGIADRVPDPMWMLGVWVLGGLIVLCGALSFAELSASMAGSRRTAVTTSSGVSGLSRAEPDASTDNALWRATCLGSSVRRAGSVVAGSDAIGNDVQSYTINRRKRNDYEWRSSLAKPGSPKRKRRRARISG